MAIAGGHRALHALYDHVCHPPGVLQHSVSHRLHFRCSLLYQILSKTCSKNENEMYIFSVCCCCNAGFIIMSSLAVMVFSPLPKMNNLNLKIKDVHTKNLQLLFSTCMFQHSNGTDQ